jgi:hypothetical protein
MTTLLPRVAVRPAPAARRVAGAVLPSVVGAVLCLAVAWIHVQDQGGLTAMEDPTYLGWMYRVLEVAGVLAAVLLVVRRRSLGWFLALGIAAGPLAGYVVTRTVGLPNATDDIGNWGEPLGVASLVVEGALLALALVELARIRRTGGA